MKTFIRNLLKYTTVDFRKRLASHRSIFLVTGMFVIVKVKLTFHPLVNLTLAQKQNQKLNQNLHEKS